MKYYKYLLFSLLLITVSCEQFYDLDVENPNKPDVESLYNNPDQFPSLINGAYTGWWKSVRDNPSNILGVGAETVTGYGGTNVAVSAEPRPPLENSITNAHINSGWFNIYATIPMVRNVVKEIEFNGKTVRDNSGNDITNVVLAQAYILLGILHGNLGLLYDKGIILAPETDLESINSESFVSYKDMIEKGLEFIDKGISLCNESFAIGSGMVPPGLAINNNEDLKGFACLYAARLIVYMARTKSESEQLPWDKVMNYINNSIRVDIGINNISPFKGYGNILAIFVEQLLRVHQRVLNMMAPEDPNAVYPYPRDGTILGEITNCPDQRLEEYFQYIDISGWSPLHASHYRVIREDALPIGDNNVDDFLLKCIVKEEIDLIEAEAILRTSGSKDIAVTLINKTRVDKGSLPPALASESVQDLLDKIMYERYVEILFFDTWVGFFDRRRTDSLYPLTFTQMPVPYKELQILGLPNYTFGGGV